ncbi:MAG: aspartate aminotransferase family protein, partial [Bacteroidia bacterium]|nr:aspartate aminotransferase family protein [Bacteroidia bacterium]
IISYTTINNDPDIFVIADQLEEKGWMIDRQQFPDCIHLTILPINVDMIDQYLIDLKKAVVFAREHHEATAKGNASFYGLMARIPFRGMVEDSVKKVMEEMYGADETSETKGIENNDDEIIQIPAWMRILNRFLSAWTRWKKSFGSKK